MSKVKYLDENDIFTAFELVQQEFDREYDKAPNYQQETEAVENLKGLNERLKMDQYYPGLLNKASILFINTVKGHYFSNGNKRIGIVTTILFLLKNELDVDNMAKADYKNKLADLFTGYNNFYDEKGYTPLDFGFYNLAKIIASHTERNIELDDLKNKTEQFLKFVTTKDSSNFIDRFKSFLGKYI